MKYDQIAEAYLNLITENIKNLKFEKMSHDDPRLVDIRNSAAIDPNLGDIIKERIGKHIVVMHNSKPVAFAIPRYDRDSRLRSGPIYTHTDYRGLGIGKHILNHIFLNKKGRSWIDSENISSQKIFSSVGFLPSGRTITYDGDTLHEWLKD